MVNEKVPQLRLSEDDATTFLADLRLLRAQAAIDYEELAGRTHYPADVLKDAECGRGLPTLPVTAAYVTACGGDPVAWEERWRRLTSASANTDDDLPSRPRGASAAAAAGARAGVSAAPAEAYDTDRIRAALRAAPDGDDEDASVLVDSTITDGGYSPWSEPEESSWTSANGSAVVPDLASDLTSGPASDDVAAGGDGIVPGTSVRALNGDRNRPPVRRVAPRQSARGVVTVPGKTLIAGIAALLALIAILVALT
ncbi:MAG TPA: helix-turn-helix transcriptional regulator [Streptosporangiaceae bacterium]|nr:helix-turn-helix transcriptional regulator [Streptosporangiaceae bacterium]